MFRSSQQFESRPLHRLPTAKDMGKPPQLDLMVPPLPKVCHLALGDYPYGGEKASFGHSLVFDTDDPDQIYQECVSPLGRPCTTLAGDHEAYGAPN